MGRDEVDPPELDEMDEKKMVYCKPCSQAGCADKPVFHAPPACTPVKCPDKVDPPAAK